MTDAAVSDWHGEVSLTARRLGASVGLTLGNAWGVAEDLLRDADTAVYAVKSAGRRGATTGGPSRG